MTYETVEVPYQEQVFETKTQQIQVPRMTYEDQTVTQMVPQMTQEPITTQVPMQQTYQQVQQVQKVVEYARMPVNQYTVPGQSYYTQPQMTQTMQMQQPMGYGQTMGMPMGYGQGYQTYGAAPAMGAIGSAQPATQPFPV